MDSRRVNPLRRFLFNSSYLARPRWDTGIPAPELVRFVESHAPGNALDIGCGTGTALLYLAQQHWQVTGLDYAPLGIKKARKKLQAYPATLLVADSTKMDQLDLPGPFDLALDMGCFHSLPADGREGYVRGLEQWLKPEATYMLYAFQPGGSADTWGIPNEEVMACFERQFTLRNYEQGRGRPSAWYYFERK